MKTVFSLLCFLMIFGFSYAQNYRFGKVSDEEIKQKIHPIDSSADAAILYREVKSKFQSSTDNSWVISTTYLERIKIYSKEGAEYANKTIDLYKTKKTKTRDKISNIKAFTYNEKPNGKTERIKLESNGIFNEEFSQYLNKTKITMPGVQEGSVIEIRYTIESPYVTNIDEYRLQEKIPIDKLHLSFSSPEDFRYKPHQKGWIPIDIKTSSGKENMTFRVTEIKDDPTGYGSRRMNNSRNINMETVVYTVDMEDIPAIEEEPYVGNIENYMSSVQFELSSIDTGKGIKSHSLTWDDVSKTIYKNSSFGAELKRTRYFEKDIKKLIKGVSDPMTKISLIYDYVQEKMTWNRTLGFSTSEGVRKAYKENTGNIAEINLMLTAMLNYAKIDAFPVLVSTKSNGIPLFPTINGFNYVITAAKTAEDNYLLLDATNKNAEMGVLSSNIMNGNGRLLFQEKQSDWIPLNSVIPAVNQTLLTVNIDNNFEISGESQQRISGNYALNYRNSFKDLNPSEWSKKIEKEYNKIEVSNVSFKNLDKTTDAINLNYSFNTSGNIEKIGEKVFISPLLFLQTKENPFKAEKRNYPIDFGFPYHSQIILNFTIPEEYEIESLPENAILTIDDKGGYKYLISQHGNNIQLSIESIINQAVIAESDYENLKDFFELLVEKENDKIVLKKV